MLDLIPGHILYQTGKLHNTFGTSLTYKMGDGGGKECEHMINCDFCNILNKI